MRNVKYVLFLLILSLSSISCQKNPSEDIVVEKNQEKLELAISTSKPESKTAEFEGPERWETAFMSSDSYLEIVVDADVATPQKALPVIQVTPHEFTVEEAKQWAEVLLEGRPAYEATNQMTKHELEERILSLKRYIGDGGALWEEYGEDAELAKMLKEEAEKTIALYEEQYESASDQMEKKETDWTFHPQYYYDSYVSIDENPEEFLNLNKTKSLNIQTEVDGLPYDFQVTNREEADFRIHSLYWGCANFDGYAEAGFEDSSEEAISLVSRTLEEGGLTNWELYSCEKKERRGMAWYDLQFIPSYEGVKVLKQDQMETVKSEDSYAANYYYESVTAQVSDGKLISLMYISPLDVVEVKNPDVELIPFADIQNRMTEQMKLQYTQAAFGIQDEPGNRSSRFLCIDEVELGLARIKIADNESDFYLVPAWNLNGRIGYKKEETTSYSDEKYTFLTVNAVDGSVINTKLGY